MSIVIREMRPEDVPVVYELGSNEPGFRAPGSDDLCFWEEDTLLQWTADPGHDVLLVAEVEGKVAGFVIATFHPLAGKAEWENECVHEDFRGRGISKALYTEMERQLREKGAKFISFIVRGDNKFLKVYEKRFGESSSVEWFVKSL